MKRLIVRTVGNWKPSKYNDFANKLIILKSIDETDRTKYKANLNSQYPARVQENEPIMKEGYILDCHMQANGINVNMFMPITIISKPQKKEAVNASQ